MVSLRKALVYGLLSWRVPFAASVGIFPAKHVHPAMFEAILSILLVALALSLATRYFRVRDTTATMEGLKLGLSWMAIHPTFDLIMVPFGQMKLQAPDFLKNSGFFYLLLPVVTVGEGRFRKIVRHEVRHS